MDFRLRLANLAASSLWSGGLLDFRSLVDIASEMTIDRFKVASVLEAIRHQFTKAA